MSWVKLDDQFFSHPKARESGRDGALLFLAGLTYCARHLTDGRIPKSAVPIIAAEAWAKPAAARKLVDVGLWHDKGDYYEAHDYLDRNPTRAKVLSDREAARERAANGGRSSRKVPPKPEDVSVTPVPVPEPQETTNSPKPQASAFEADFDELWARYPRRVDRGQALAQYQARRREGVEHAELLAAVGHYAEATDGVDRQFVKHGATFLGKRGAWAEWVNGPPADALSNGALGAKPLEPPSGQSFVEGDPGPRSIVPYVCALGNPDCRNGLIDDEDRPAGTPMQRCECTKAKASA